MKTTGYDECKLSCESFLNLNSFSDCFSIRAMFDERFTDVSHQILKIQSLTIFYFESSFRYSVCE